MFNQKTVKTNVILSIGILGIVVGIAITGMAMKSVQAVTPDPVAIKKAALHSEKHS